MIDKPGAFHFAFEGDMFSVRKMRRIEILRISKIMIWLFIGTLLQG